MTAGVRTTCPYCGVGCGVVVGGNPSSPVVSGDPAHPANFGRLCSKGSALAETLSLEGRLLQPKVRGRTTEWPEALQAVADGFTRIIAEHGPEAVAFYVSGQLLTEDYYVANKFMKGFIGTANIDTNSRLCMSSAVSAHVRSFGEDVVPVGYEDLDAADLIVLVGSNTAWCHPVLFQRIVQTKERRPRLKIVLVDPRRTPTADIADLHLPLQPGSDVCLFNGLLNFLHERGAEDRAFTDAHTRDIEQALTAAHDTAGSIESTAKACGLQAADLLEFFGLFERTARVVTLFSQGVNQSSAGTDKANSIINCHLLTGRIGKPGAGPFSITGQPNAMGGREVGGLATTLAAHMDLSLAAHRDLVQGFWGSPRIASKPGLKAVDLFEAVHAGRVKAIWIAGTNPIVSMPNANRVRAALEGCELVVVSDCVAETDTTVHAHVLLPAATWGEKEGTVTNSDRTISRQRAFLPLPESAMPDWWIFCEVAKRMGFSEGFNFSSAHEIFVEHARLSTVGNDGTRAFDIGALGELTRAAYDALTPVRWPVRVAQGQSPAPMADGRFFHADGRARFIATIPRAPRHALDEEYPLALNTGRIRDQWHTMTRTGRAARLMSHAPEPFVDMHAEDALLARVRAGELVKITTRWGSMVARLRTSTEIARHSIFVPIHWNSLFSSNARVGALVNPVVDPVSGEPEFKHTPARVVPFVVAWQGFALSRKQLTIRDATAWSLALTATCWRYELAGRRVFGNWSPWARRMLDASAAQEDWIEYVDRGTGVYRAAHFIDGRLEACVFLSPRPDLPSRLWLAGLFQKPVLEPQERMALLIGAPIEAGVDAGETICSCFNVGRNTIAAKIQSAGLRSTAEIGQCLKAGTNCGSCLPELRGILSSLLADAAAVPGRDAEASMLKATA